MAGFTIRLPSGGGGEGIELTAPNLVTALTVADINLTDGSSEVAEIVQGPRHIASVRKRGDGRGIFWEVNSAKASPKAIVTSQPRGLS